MGNWLHFKVYLHITDYRKYNYNTILLVNFSHKNYTIILVNFSHISQIKVIYILQQEVATYWTCTPNNVTMEHVVVVTDLKLKFLH